MYLYFGIVFHGFLHLGSCDWTITFLYSFNYIIGTVRINKQTNKQTNVFIWGKGKQQTDTESSSQNKPKLVNRYHCCVGSKRAACSYLAKKQWTYRCALSVFLSFSDKGTLNLRALSMRRSSTVLSSSSFCSDSFKCIFSLSVSSLSSSFCSSAFCFLESGFMMNYPVGKLPAHTMQKLFE